MTRQECIDFMDQAERFAGATFVQANRHLEAGEDGPAGMLLALRARVGFNLERWQKLVTPPGGWPTDAAPAPAPATTGKCRHDFVASESRGDNPPVCSKCNQPKAANGRPRRQAVLPVGGAA